MASSEPSFRRQRASPWLRTMLKVPTLIYFGPLADLMRSRCVLLLTTRGRATGRPRTGGVSFMPIEDHFVVFSGWGVGSNWFKNIRADPEVIVTVGRQKMRATARVVEDPDRRRALMLQMQARSRGCGLPRLIRPVLKLTHVFDYDGEIEMAVAAGSTLPVVEIFPRRD
jgi:deazaflavin-dependent oxidoreductase (nitroreductase family)